ncbi:MAG TPA: glycosyltransferase family 2 protein [Lacibacter sp.]|nr:glycosyltransferase family 2 protein [Lacibacter sp.]
MSHKNVLISIIMPLYNAEKYLPVALEQLQQQTFTDYELLLLDALSTDGTAAIARQMMQQNDRIRWFSRADAGIYDAMNNGVAQAKGAWVYFMGCDDTFHHTGVLQDVALHLDSDADMVYGDVQWMPGGELEAGVCTPQDLLHRNINHQRIFYRRSLFEQYGGYDLQYKIASDHELNIRFFCNDAIRKKYIPVTIARYHAGGFSANKLDAVFWGQWKSIFKVHFAKHLPLKQMYEKLGWYCRYLIDQKQYAKAFPLFWDVLLHTWSPGFVWLTGKQFLQSFKQHAG